jgi:hypothetical protein
MSARPGICHNGTSPAPSPCPFAVPAARRRRCRNSGNACNRPFACTLYICKKSPAQWRYPTRVSADFATRRDSITLQVLGAVAKLERPLIAERNAAQRLSIPAPIRSEHLGSPSTGFS